MAPRKFSSLEKVETPEIKNTYIKRITINKSVDNFCGYKVFAKEKFFKNKMCQTKEGPS